MDSRGVWRGLVRNTPTYWLTQDMTEHAESETGACFEGTLAELQKRADQVSAARNINDYDGPTTCEWSGARRCITRRARARRRLGVLWPERFPNVSRSAFTVLFFHPVGAKSIWLQPVGQAVLRSRQHSSARVNRRVLSG